MKYLKYPFLCLLFILSQQTFAQSNTSAIEQEKFYDLFSGTFIEKNNQLYLHSCQTIDVEFKLKFNHLSDKQHIQELMQKHQKFWLYLRANAEMENNEYVMTVDGIAEEYLNKTCHLTELLDEL